MMGDDCLQKYSGGVSQSNESRLSIKSNASNFVKLDDLPPARNIHQKNYSVEPDMLNGWRPRGQKNQPQKIIIPIQTSHAIVDQIVDNIMSRRSNGLKVSYLGPRHQNSYELHQFVSECDRSHKNPYRYNTMGTVKSDRPFVGNNSVLKSKSLQFNSQIQSGNLDVAIMKNQLQYDLFMRVDTNTRGHTSWYNFTIKNHSIVGKVRLNILNFRKQRSLYERNMKPFIKQIKKQKQWEQKGQIISYKQSKPFFYDFMTQKPNRKVYKIINARWKNFTLSFSYQFKEEDDQIQIAYCIPYPLSRLTKMVQNIRDHEFVEISTLTKSLGNIDIPLITITDHQYHEKKKVIIITGRVHPGESNSSFIAEGLIKSLCSENFSTKKLRKEYVFKVIPMLNPDGVIAGNYRTGFMGVDLNRIYDQDKACFPETVALKKLVKSQAKRIQHPIDYYIDLHGHSIKKNSFLYGPQHELNSNKYNECRILARCLSNLTSMFRYYSCIWRISTSKQTTARAVFFKKLNISNCYTLQSSNGSYFDRVTSKEIHYNQKSWVELGGILLKGINESAQEITKQKEEIKNMRSKRQSRRSQIISFTLNKLQQKQQKCSDDEIIQGDSDSQPEDHLQLDEFLCLRELLLQNQKQQHSAKKLKLNLIPYSSQKKYSLHTKARTILTINQEETKLPMISVQPPKRQSSKSKKTKQIVSQKQKPQKPSPSKIDFSELIQRRKSVREQDTGFASIMNRMVLNFNMNVKSNSNGSSKSIHETEKKSFRYISRSMVMKESKPTRFIQNLKFQ